MNIEDYLKRKEKRLEQVSRRIRDFRVFDFNYVPSSPIMRDEVKPVADAILRYVKTGVPNNLLVIGSRGSGKTMLVRYLAEKLIPGQGGRYFYVNCRHHNTSFKILAEILKVKPRGYGLDELWSMFQDRVREPVILILDEVDLMSDKDRQKEILYLLSRAERSVMAIMLSNNPRLHLQLDASVASTLQPDLVHFRNYDARQVLSILKQRGRLGLYKSPEAMLAHIAGLTARDAGSDVRIGIRTLYLCASDPTSNVQDVFERARRDVVAEMVAGLSDQNLIILKAAESTDDGHVKVVYEAYRRISEAASETPFSYVHFYSNLSYMQSAGLIMLVSTKIRKTYTNRIQLLFGPDVLMRVWASRFG